MNGAALYAIARHGLFRLDAETAHELTIQLLSRFPRIAGATMGARVSAAPRTVMGLSFSNPVGLAAGLDKNGECIDGMAALGFGFIEVGTVTPRPQPGNPKPRLFRLAKQQALINRLGFNNHGVDYLLEQLRCTRYRGILGINIGKNFDTPLEKAVDDYLTCLEKVYAAASYVTINISSPNTQGLRSLQQGEALDDLLMRLKQAQQRLSDQHGRYVPLVIKIAPDLENEHIDGIADALRRYRMDGAIATNTTVERDAVKGSLFADEAGGLSGAPLMRRSTAVLSRLCTRLAGELPVIGLGGINSGADAVEKQAAGAALVQIYTGFIYRGPDLIRECAEALSSK